MTDERISLWRLISRMLLEEAKASAERSWQRRKLYENKGQTMTYTVNVVNAIEAITTALTNAGWEFGSHGITQCQPNVMPMPDSVVLEVNEKEEARLRVTVTVEGYTVRVGSSAYPKDTGCVQDTLRACKEEVRIIINKAIAQESKLEEFRKKYKGSLNSPYNLRRRNALITAKIRYDCKEAYNILFDTVSVAYADKVPTVFTPIYSVEYCGNDVGNKRVTVMDYIAGYYVMLATSDGAGCQLNLENPSSRNTFIRMIGNAITSTEDLWLRNQFVIESAATNDTSNA
jgi:hypothetical protein